MEEREDYIEREIKRLSSVLSQLITKALGLQPKNCELRIKKIESNLISEFDLSLRELSQMNNAKLLNTIKKLNSNHLEQLAELIAVVVKNGLNYPTIKLALKGILMLHYLDKYSETYSFKRVALKKQLEDVIIK